MRLKLIACEILHREVCATVARSTNTVDVVFMPKGLHDIGAERMGESLREAVEAVDEESYDAIVLGYGLCSNGVVGLAARNVPLVIPRGHDCITLFLGGKERYLEYFTAHPGVYYKTTGWIERGDDLEQLTCDSVQRKNGMTQSYDELVEKYGEENAGFLFQQMKDMTSGYHQITFIEMGVEPNDVFMKRAKQDADEKGWDFEHVRGDISLIQAAVDGEWDEERFLVVQPGYQIAACHNEQIVKAVKTDDC